MSDSRNCKRVVRLLPAHRLPHRLLSSALWRTRMAIATFITPATLTFPSSLRFYPTFPCPDPLKRLSAHPCCFHDAPSLSILSSVWLLEPAPMSQSHQHSLLALAPPGVVSEGLCDRCCKPSRPALLPRSLPAARGSRTHSCQSSNHNGPQLSLVLRGLILEVSEEGFLRWTRFGARASVRRCDDLA